MMKKTKLITPKIGMRIIKTVIAVFLSISIYLVLLLITNKMGLDRTDLNSPTIIYTPFFAAIAAVYALHKDNKSSLTQAKIRSFGSVVGGYFGMFVILISDFVLINIFNLYETNFVLYTLITYIIVSVSLIPLIWLTVLLKQQTASFITCLTYFSVTISIRNGGLPVTLFATNRVLSTLVGVGIALLVNNVSLFKNSNKNILFVSSLDNNLLSQTTSQMDSYLKYKINNLYYKEMPLTFVTTRTLSTLKTTLNELSINIPIAVMNGAAIYHFDSKTYDEVYTIAPEERKIIEKILSDADINYFTYAIDDNMLHAFYSKICNPAQKHYYDFCRKSDFDNFVRASLPSDSGSSLYIILEKKEVVDQLYEKLSINSLKDKIDLVVYPFDDVKGDYYYLKINSVSSKKENLINTLKNKFNYDKIIVCGSGNTDVNIIRMADFSVALSTAPDYVLDEVDLVLNDNPIDVLKVFEKIYHSTDFEKTISKLKGKYHK